MIEIGILCVLLTLASYVLTRCIYFYALKKNILDIPNERSSHQLPTPRGGGLAFVFLFYVVLIVLFLNQLISSNIFIALLGGIFIAGIGYCDDLFHVKSHWRALTHLLSAAWGLAWLHGIPHLFFGSQYFYAPVLLFILAIIVTVWFINLYNFMDGIDGLASMEAVFVSFAAGCFLFFSGFVDTALICFALTFSVLGFLIVNWPPAKIFMGDIGSGFIGYILAMLMWITNNQHQLAFPIWWILLSLFIADASFTLIYRMIQKKSWLSAHKEHAYQRLTQSGFSHLQVTLGMLFINLFICLPLCFFYLHITRSTIAGLLFLIILSLWLTWFLISKNSMDTEKCLT